MYFNAERKFIGANNVFVIDVMWYQNIGIVIAQDVITLEFKSYIKDINMDAPHLNTEAIPDQMDKDVAKILSYGSTFPLASALEIFSYLKDFNNDKIIFPILKNQCPEFFV